MGKLPVYALAIAAVACALLLSPGGVRADSLTGSVGITWLFPNTSTSIASDTIAVGSSLSCPGASSLCAFFPGSAAFSVAPSSISYTASIGSQYAVDPFNGFDFTGLTFLGGGSLTGFTLATDIAGLSPSNVTFGPSFIEINLQGLPTDSFFTLNLISSVPEPASLALLGTGLLALAGFMRRKART
jgi:PEP-CTERM motif